MYRKTGGIPCVFLKKSRTGFVSRKWTEEIPWEITDLSGTFFSKA